MKEAPTVNSITSLLNFGISLRRARIFPLVGSDKNGLLAVAGIACASIAVVVYLVALYSAFEASFLLNRIADEKSELSEKIVVLELQLQKRQADFRLINIPELENMEKISSIRYIGGENATAYLPQSVR
ncbi:MAG: hypothetical protein HYT37_01025 [Candidatus Sungbacteria bacterium]|nr:hypothetical protein [Candidatus Sungbacteria bacterium]